MFMRFGKNQSSNTMTDNTSGAGTKKRVLVVIGILMALVLVFGLAFSFLFSGGDETAQQTLKLAQQHTELIRISEIGAKQARAQDTKNLATTVKLVLQSSESEVVAIAKRDQPVSNTQLSAGKNTKTDTLLETAEQTNRFDEAFIETLFSQLRAYQQSLKTTHAQLSSAKEKQTLNDLYIQIDKLLPKS